MDIKARIKERFQDKIIHWQENSARRVYFAIRKEDLVEVVKYLFKDLELRFAIATGTDTPDAFELLYHFGYDEKGEVYTIRVLLEDKAHPQIDSIANLFPGAEWIEREIWEMLGINFAGHPNLKKLLLADDWPEGNYPLRHKT